MANTLLQRLLSGCGGEHCDRALQRRSGGDHSDPELAVRVRRGTLRSLAVEVWWRTLCSRGCCPGAAGNTAIERCSGGQAGITLILSLLFGSGRGGGTAGIKSNNANLTGREISKKCGHITYSYGHLLLITGHK